MLPVEILPVQETIVLRARGSELLILPHHVKRLKALAKSRDFSEYFRSEALVNRPARKLFEAWLRKDHTLWARLYKSVQEMDIAADNGEAAPAEAAAGGEKPVAAPAPAKVEAKPVKAKAEAPVEIEVKKEPKAARAESKKTEAAEKPEKKTAAKSTAKSEKKDTAAAKPAAKKAKADEGKTVAKKSAPAKKTTKKVEAEAKPKATKTAKKK